MVKSKFNPAEDFYVPKGCTKAADCWAVFRNRDKAVLRPSRHGGWDEAPVSRNAEGRLQVPVRAENGSWVTKGLHKLQYESFVGPVPKGFDVHHKDDNA